MRDLKLILGFAGFLLCFWMTSGLLAPALLEPDEPHCATLERETSFRPQGNAMTDGSGAAKIAYRICQTRAAISPGGKEPSLLGRLVQPAG
ncbi:hypothetical protein [Teichococcus oryzae]|uniref:Uncharacterized protein n=1 Tax=Teichococcus oryzae TaxID=1608942 RepID=A0A5B2TJQ4_9PROT|nr:hypothetical protein [Pseudoroseomonas oryzae]KAA2214696.1 hypothetical protein F0Q34_03080 [Pseudoroseomonas oryzae]